MEVYSVFLEFEPSSFISLCAINTVSSAVNILPIDGYTCLYLIKDGILFIP